MTSIGNNSERVKIMGMSASQARFLCLTARKSNVEFEGQQINQQRTTLSNQSASYYAELCNMVVPTPPSIDDFTKVSYSFDDGALKNTITSMIAKANNQYSISYIQQWQDDYSIVSAASSIIAKDGNDYKIGSATLRTLGADINITDPDQNSDPYLKSLTPEQLQDLLRQEEYYKAMLNDKFGTQDADYFVRYVKDSTSGTYLPYFYKKDQVTGANYDDNTGLMTGGSIDCYSIGSATKTREVINALGSVEKDSSGRYMAVMLYQTDSEGHYISTDGEKMNEQFQVLEQDVNGQWQLKLDSNGAPILGTPTFIEYSLTTNTTTDQDAYDDAMNQYNYKQYLYDQKIQEINSKIEIIQQQDKTLELELKSLDTEEQALNTELDAVKKVISNNIDKSFKTFSA